MTGKNYTEKFAGRVGYFCLSLLSNFDKDTTYLRATGFIEKPQLYQTPILRSGFGLTVKVSKELHFFNLIRDFGAKIH